MTIIFSFFSNDQKKIILTTPISGVSFILSTNDCWSTSQGFVILSSLPWPTYTINCSPPINRSRLPPLTSSPFGIFSSPLLFHLLDGCLSKVCFFTITFQIFFLPFILPSLRAVLGISHPIKLL